MPQKPKFVLKPLPSSESIGSRIALFRKRRGMTQLELAVLIGIDNVLVSHYERNRLHLHDDMLARFAIALNVSADDLLGIKKRAKSSQPDIGLRFMKRLLVIETFPETQKKRILRNLDDAIKAFSK
jgi:transcriptional regulator with XRE-family HTH domain